LKSTTLKSLSIVTIADRHPSVPWIYLPRTEADGETRRGFLLAAYLKMWRGPRLARERVQNRYAGKLIP
jgi:hypothetical protein